MDNHKVGRFLRHRVVCTISLELSTVKNGNL